MATIEITTAETLSHLDVIWYDNADTLQEVFRTALGRTVTYTRVGERNVQIFGEDGALRHLYRLTAVAGTLTAVERHGDGVTLALTIGGARALVNARHPVADATLFALTVSA